MQKTNFPFEVIVHDDASTDRTADIIREYEKKYPKIITPIYETENQYSKHDGSINRIVNPFLKGKYVAFCEGDDYWIDENKLQMQVDFLEANPEYGMCYTKAISYIQKTKKYESVFGGPSVTFDDLVKKNIVPTMTVVLKKDLYLDYQKDVEPQNKNWKLGDYPIWLWFSLNSKIKLIEKLTATYRILLQSASHFSNAEDYVNFIQSDTDIKNFFLKRTGRDLVFIDKNRIKFKYYFSQNINRKESLNALKKIENPTTKEKLLYPLICNNGALFLGYRGLSSIKKNVKRFVDKRKYR